MKRNLPKIAGVFFLYLILAAQAFAGDSLPKYELSVSFDLAENLLRGKARITIPTDEDMNVYTSGLSIVEAAMDGERLDANAISSGEGIGVSGGGVLEIGYEKVFGGTGAEVDPENVGVTGSVVSGEGISLTGMWYPRIDGLAYHSLKATVPEGFVAVSEADAITEKAAPEGREFSFHFPYPSEGMTLAAGRYVVAKSAADDVEIYAYFFEEDAALAEEYIDYTRRYLTMYKELLGDYPFKRFSVVENFVPTGYSMSTFTLLGSDVVRLPFIVETSLGHEILHQWFGNSVYGDPEGGNWLEGITNYLADHMYKELEGEAELYRKNMLVDYQSYVTAENEIPLEDFGGRVDRATRAVGYGKGAMFFHMLKNLIGEDAFVGALRGITAAAKFRRTSWEDLRLAFEKSSGAGLQGFFDQWTMRPDVPYLEVAEPRVLYIDGVPNVTFKLRQRAEPYALKIKARVISDKGEFDETLDIYEKEKSFRLLVEGTPLELVLDPGYDMMRELWPEEFPPTISRLLGDEKRLVVIPEDGVDDYLHLTRVLKEEGFIVKLDDEVRDEDIVTSSVLLLGADGPVHRRLFGVPPVDDIEEGFQITVMENPLNPDRVLAVAVASAREEVEAAARKIFHYGKYSHLKFVGGRNAEKETAESETGMRVALRHEVSGIRPQSALSLEEIIAEIIDKGIIYVGESHSDYEDHRVQLDVIRALRERGRKFAIGMEMFQTPFQNALDGYIAGRTTEKEFLKASEYFKRWKFDYHLYREILQYARANGIPVLALNTDADIVKKVSGGGLDALSAEESGSIPPDMDMADTGYWRMLRKVFALHENPRGVTFENFYQAQILRDETMAHVVDGFMRDNPGHQVVVLAGMGHIGYSYGIPQRVYRLNGRDFAMLISSNVDTIEEGMADYIFFPEPLKPPVSPVLGVMLKEENGKVEVQEVRAGTAAAEAGLKSRDVLLAVDGQDVGEIADVKIALFDHQEGDTIAVKVLRKRLFGSKEMDLDVTLK